METDRSGEDKKTNSWNGKYDRHKEVKEEIRSATIEKWTINLRTQRIWYYTIHIYIYIYYKYSNMIRSVLWDRAASLAVVAVTVIVIVTITITITSMTIMIITSITIIITITITSITICMECSMYADELPSEAYGMEKRKENEVVNQRKPKRPSGKPKEQSF